MITSTMTSQEISNLIDKDRDRINKYIGYRYKEMERNLRKGFAKSASKVIDYSTQNAKYKIILYVTGRFHTFSLLAFNHESNEWIDVTFSSKKICEQMQYVARSVHFFNRYAERFLGTNDMDLNDIILKFYNEVNCFIVLYHKNDHIVYASSNGIVLAIFDEKKNITHVITYVSAEMLKYSQFSSWVKVWSACQRLSDLAKLEVQENGRLSPEKTSSWTFTEEEKLTIEEASEIYGKFFKHREK